MNLITDAATEPISVAEFKLNAKVDGTSEDATTIPLYILAARKHFEKATDRALITQTWEIAMERVPSRFYFPIAPIQSVTSVKYLDGAGVEQTLATTDYALNLDSRVPQLKVINKPSISTDEIRNFIVRFVAGYGDDATDVPGDIRQAILYMATQMYENRLPVVQGRVVNEVPMTFNMLTDQHKFHQL